jgi:polyisoprenyl-teichoic acid--peptidoglycan teichoic acid transferase
VDMYAFIEIVDILGGIDVTLDEPLVDPTYRVRENGQWGTLYYETGTHHLGGVAALRLARSRHTSNDFERALRQQKILAALRERINSLHAGDLDRVYGIIETLGQYVDSSYSLWQLTQFFLAYRNAEIVNRTGLTFDNVLYSTYSNVHLQGLDFDEIDDDFVTGEWILLPRGDDWSVIPWFVEENIR